MCNVLSTIFSAVLSSVLLCQPAFAQSPPSSIPSTRYNSQINASDYVVTQEQKGKWAVNCRQRINPEAGDKRCSATDGRQILKFKTTAPAPAVAFEKAVTLENGYILQLAAFSSQQSALKFQQTYPSIPTQVISTTVQNIKMFNVITPVIENFNLAQSHAEKTSQVLGYLPWIRTTDSI